jgi:integrase
MEFVEPIRNPKKIAQIKNQLKGEKRWRDLLLFTFGINTALRISDLLRIQAQDVITDDRAREYFIMVEEKTGKRHNVTINESMIEALELYRSFHQRAFDRAENYLMVSERAKPFYSKPIDRTMAWRLISEMCHDAGLMGNYGTHTLRKTWGYQARMQGIDMEIIMHKLNHSSFAMTRRYLGITDDEIQAAVMKVNL